MNILLWIVQVLLALLFLMSGVMKVLRPYDAYKENARTAYAESYSPSFIKFIGVVEVLGAIGLILPALTGILPWLTPLAAAGLAIIMAGAVATHFRRSEYPPIVVNLILLAGVVFIAYGRFVAVPIV